MIAVIADCLRRTKMRFTTDFLAASWLFGAAWAQNASSVLQFGPVTFAGYNNYVYRNNITSAQVLLSEWVWIFCCG